jgi:hypothetical protein
LNDDGISEVREALMGELEKKDPVAFDRWITSDPESEMDYPSKFFTATNINKED